MRIEHLKAILWKCWCMRKRNYVSTFVEIVVPILLVTIATSVIGSGNSSDHPVQNATTPFVPPPYDENLIFILSRDTHLEWDLLYTPPQANFTNVVNKAVDILKSHRFQIANVIPMDNEQSIESWFREEYANETRKGFGIIFKQEAKGLHYTIREALAENEGSADLFPAFETPGPMHAGNYFLTGYLALQIALDKAYMQMANIEVGNITLQEFPYPAYRPIDVQQDVLMIISLVLYFGYYILWPTLVKTVILEKKTGAREWLKMVGVPGWLLWLHWIFYSMFTFFITSFICTIILTVPLFGPAPLGSNPLIIWIFIFLFCTSCCFLALLISTLFMSPVLGSSVAGGFFMMAFSITFNHVYAHNLSHTESLFASLFPIYNLLISMKSIASAETLKSGVTFHNLFSYHGKVLGLGFYMIMSLVSLCLYSVLIWYIDSVRPGKFGRAKPWNFVFAPIVRMLSKPNDSSVINNLHQSGLYEEVDESLKVGLSIRNVHKKYGHTCALECINLDIYEGQITALLGHNGAGKTTLMSIVAGLFSPTSGSVYSSDGDIYDVLYEYRNNLGLCLQHNLLFDYFTVEEHLIIFSMVKGIPEQHYSAKNQELLSKFNLLDKKNEFAGKLSGGMKRKLCLAISLIGNPKVLILDEPTSGMDPESRRSMWDMLLAMRGDRTIIISTHFMEEADALGDRIAIISLGNVKCYATPIFLKKHYGEGYYLNISKAPLADSGEIVSCMKKHVTNISIVSDSELQLTVNLPTSETFKFKDLFNDLENNFNRLKITSIGLSCTTLEDVFLKVSKDASGKVSEEEEFNKPQPAMDEEGSSFRKLQGFSLFVQRMMALIIKKFYWVSHNLWSTGFYMVVVPFFVSWVTIRVHNSTYETFISPKLPAEMAIDLSAYGKTTVLLEAPLNGPNAGLSRAFKTLAETSGSTVLNVSSNITDELLKFGEDDEDFYRHHMITSATFKDSVTILYSSIAVYSLPISVSYFYNTYLNMLGKETIQTSSDPILLHTTDICSEQVLAQLEILPLVWMVTFPLGLIVVVGSFIKFYFEERMNCGKHLQFMSGVSPLTYWFSGFFWDFLLILCSVFLILLTLSAFDSSSLIASFVPLGVLAIIIVLVALSSLWFAYFVSFFFNTSPSCYNFYILGNTIFSVAGGLLTLLLSDKYKFLKYIFNLNPFYVLIMALKNAILIIIGQYRCHRCPNLERHCKFMEKSGALSFFTWDNGINLELVYLAADLLLYMILTFLMEYNICQRVFHYFFKIYVRHTDTLDTISDDDVSCEKDRVDSVITPGDTVDSSAITSPEVVVKNLGMKYKKDFIAVEDVNFVVDKGEVFGLLGVNGAGKTTTFKMLTGVILPTKGTSFIHGFHLGKERSEYLSHIGYCPQFEALNESLTAEELLITYAQLRGLSPEDAKTVTQFWISLIGLEKYCNRCCGQYSGGNKRKLSTAIAFIGDPDVIFLDEPTSGVDPVTRRKLWNILSKVKAKKQAVIITSHSMDECEAVCKRLTIMAKGRMQCIGNIQHLKHKYGDGYSLLLKLKPSTSVYTKELLKQRITEVFGHECELKDEHVGILQYHIRSANHSWSEVFSILEMLKSSEPEVEDYIVTTTSLEQVFLSFANMASSQ